MRVLLVGTRPDAVDDTRTVLEDAGHEVVQCRDAHAEAFACTALTDRGSCPFEVGPVDVVVTARERALGAPAAREDGAVCGIHRLVPLVVHGATAADPFAPWAAAESQTSDELRAAVLAVGTAPLPEHGRTATATLRDVLTVARVDPAGSDAVVTRVNGRLVVRLDLAPDARDHAPNATVRILTALRALDPYADGIDVVRV